MALMASSESSKHAAAGDPGDAIPMKKSSPMTVIAIVGALVVVGGVVAFTTLGGKKDKTPAAAQGAQPAAVDTSNMTPEEQKRHLEITQKSIAIWKEQKAAEDAKKKAAEEAAKEKEATAAAPAGGGGPVAKAPSGGGEEPPAAPKKPPKKQMDELDGLGSDIAGQLGK